MSNQLAERPSTDLRVMIQSDKIREQLAMALPQYYSPDQFTVIVRTAINRNPKLMECDPGSFMTSMITAAQMGIAPDGRNGHLIPRYNGKSQRMECTFQPDYKGLVGLVRRNDNVQDIYAEPVHDNDVFKITKGLHRDLIHEVDVRAERGAFIGAYAVISYKNGTHSFEFMSKSEIDAIKGRSQSGNSGPWVTDYSEMAKKTVIKRLLKLADLSQETADRIAIDTTIEISPSQNEPEIKQATIPAKQAALPTPTPKPEQTPDGAIGWHGKPEPTPEPAKPQPKAEPAEKPARKLTPKPKPEATPVEAEVLPPATPQEDPESPAAICSQRLKEAGHTESDLIKLGIDQQWIDIKTTPDAKLDTLDNDILQAFIDDWDTVIHEIKAAKKQA